MDRAVRSALPRLVAKNAGIEPGNVVIFDITGPVVGRTGVRVEVGEGGKPLGTPLFTGTVHEHPEDAQVTSIILSTDAITRRAAGRGGLDDIHFTSRATRTSPAGCWRHCPSPTDRAVPTSDRAASPGGMASGSDEPP